LQSVEYFFPDQESSAEYLPDFFYIDHLMDNLRRLMLYRNIFIKISIFCNLEGTSLPSKLPISFILLSTIVILLDVLQENSDFYRFLHHLFYHLNQPVI